MGQRWHLAPRFRGRLLTTHFRRRHRRPGQEFRVRHGLAVAGDHGAICEGRRQRHGQGASGAHGRYREKGTGLQFR